MNNPTIPVELGRAEYQKVLAIVKANRDLYENPSQFIRAAVKRVLRERQKP